MNVPSRDEIAASVVAEIMDRHFQVEGERRRHRDGFTTDYACAECAQPWPCDTAALFDAVEWALRESQD
jgi:hypothetical protein